MTFFSKNEKTKKNYRIKVGLIFFGMSILLLIVVGMKFFKENNGNQNPLDANRPILLTIWHYRVGSAKVAFDKMIEEFNDSIGQEQGIVVEAFSMGNIHNLRNAVHDSALGKMGAEPMPDMFTAYNQHAYEADQLYGLVDLEKYFDEEELLQYNQIFLANGRIGGEQKLKNFPVAMSGECIYLNRTDWDKFARETGAELEDLATWEGILHVAEQYYKWTEEKNLEEGGKAFWGSQDIVNFMKVTAAEERESKGIENKEGAALYYSREAAKKVWLYYYEPCLKGYYSFDVEKTQSLNAIKSGEILMGIASTAGAKYCPTEVWLNENERYPIEWSIMPYPCYKGGKKYVAGRGNSYCVVKGDYAHEYASVVFLKWFTDAVQNVEYAISTGYLPVKKEALEQENSLLRQGKATTVVQKAQNIALNMLKEYIWYEDLVTENSYDFDMVFYSSISKKAKEDREQMERRVANGENREDVLATYLSEVNFESWYDMFLLSH